jgi:hypothetical protein
MMAALLHAEHVVDEKGVGAQLRADHLQERIEV